MLKALILPDDPAVTQAERAREGTVLPYYLEAWDHYPAVRAAPVSWPARVITEG